MGSSHAAAYHEIDDFEITGLVSRGTHSRETLNRMLGNTYPLFSDFKQALKTTQPDVVSINTYPDTHEEYAFRALAAGSHVFLEKPVAPTIEGCRRVIKAANDANRKLVVGYILRHHPSWMKFIEVAGTLGKPLVMRMNLNRQSSGRMWERHKNLMVSTSTIVDSGVHYVDIMCQMTGADPIRVSGVGARLSDEIKEGTYNYGQLQVAFDDGSVGWYEAGWGPMMSESGFSLREVFGPKGSVSIAAHKTGVKSGRESLRIHHSELDNNNLFVNKDEIIDLHNEPDHKELCRREQQYLLRAIREELDLTDHMEVAMNSLKIVLAADESIKTGKTVELQ
jgi:predicted dehydrogenase